MEPQIKVETENTFGGPNKMVTLQCDGMTLSWMPPQRKLYLKGEGDGVATLTFTQAAHLDTMLDSLCDAVDLWKIKAGVGSSS